MNIQKLYRAVSQVEYDDWLVNGFQTSNNTLEVKQFFRSRRAVDDFIKQSKKLFTPPYIFIIEVQVPRSSLDLLGVDFIELDTHEAVSVDEALLPEFNNCITFTIRYDI